MNTEITPLTYPARPVNGGPLDKALPKTGDWYYEPKYNGWRALVHVPTGTMFNRHGKRLSIERDFHAALRILRKTFEGIGWLDCEGLERRHNLGRGSLIVLDLPERRGTWLQRHKEILLRCIGLGIECLDPDPDNFGVREHDVYFSMAIENHPPIIEQLWSDGQATNKMLGVEFFEGLVAKRADSLYPLQLRSDREEFPFWIKHRWAF